MARPKKIIRPVELNISLPEDVVAKMHVELFSEVEGRIPHGARAKYIERLIREDQAKRKGNENG